MTVNSVDFNDVIHRKVTTREQTDQTGFQSRRPVGMSPEVLKRIQFPFDLNDVARFLEYDIVTF